MTKLIKTLALSGLLIVGIRLRTMAQTHLDGKLAAITEITAKKGSEEAIRAAVAALQPLAVKEPGCLLFSSTTMENDPRTIILFEIFKDKAALNAHKRQPHTIMFGKQLEGKYESNKITFLNTLNTIYKK